MSDFTLYPKAAVTITAADTAELSQKIAALRDRVHEGYGLTTSSSSLNVTLAKGRAYITGREVGEPTVDADVVKALVANSTNYIYLDNVANIQINQTGVAPSNSILLWQAVTNGTGVTSSTDKRDLSVGHDAAHKAQNYTADGSDAFFKGFRTTMVGAQPYHRLEDTTGGGVIRRIWNRSGKLQVTDDAGTTLTDDLGAITVTGTAGSVFFAGSDTKITQDNANFFWDITNKRLGIGTAAPAQALHVIGTGRFSLGLIVDALTQGSIPFVGANGAISQDNTNLSWISSILTVGGDVQQPNNKALKGKNATGTSKVIAKIDASDLVHLGDTSLSARVDASSGDLKVWDGSAYKKIWHESNDGAGSTLDADLLDGLDSLQFLRADTNAALTGGDLTFDNNKGIKGKTTGAVAKNLGKVNSSNQVELGDVAQALRLNSLNGDVQVWDGTAFKKVWHESNDGPNSTLDADTVDGAQLSNIVQKSDNAAGDISGTFGSNLLVKSVSLYDQTDILTGPSTGDILAQGYYNLGCAGNGSASVSIGNQGMPGYLGFHAPTIGTSAQERVFRLDLQDHGDASRASNPKVVAFSGAKLHLRGFYKPASSTPSDGAYEQFGIVVTSASTNAGVGATGTGHYYPFNETEATRDDFDSIGVVVDDSGNIKSYNVAAAGDASYTDSTYDVTITSGFGFEVIIEWGTGVTAFSGLKVTVKIVDNTGVTRTILNAVSPVATGTFPTNSPYILFMCNNDKFEMSKMTYKTEKIA